MTLAAPLRRAAPAFLLGLSLALSGQMGAGLLLYGGPGLVQALSVILATLALALASGILTAQPRRRPHHDPVGNPTRSVSEQARRGWLALLLALSLAALFSMGWELFRGFSVRGLTQGIGLGVGLALPFHTGGRVLGLLGRSGSGVQHAASAVLAGAAVGFLLLGFVLFPSLSPTAVILLGLVAASGGALAHGWVLDEVTVEERTSLSEDLPLPPGVSAVVLVRERRVRPPLDRVRVEDGSRVRMEREVDGSPRVPLDVVLEEALLPLLPPPGQVAGAGWRVLPLVLRWGGEGRRVFGAAHPGEAARLLEAWPDLDHESLRVRLVALEEVLGPRGADRVNGVAGAAGGDSVDSLDSLSSDEDLEAQGAPWLVLDAEEAGGADMGAWAHHVEALGPRGVLVVVGLPDRRPGGDPDLVRVPDGALHPAEALGPPGEGSQAPRPSIILEGLEELTRRGIPAVAYAGPSRAAGLSDAPSREGVLLAGLGLPGPSVWPDRAGPFALVPPHGSRP